MSNFKPLIPRFVASLQQSAIVAENTLDQALLLATETGGRIDEVLTKLGHVTPNQISEIERVQLGVHQLIEEELAGAKINLVGVPLTFCRDAALLPMVGPDGEDFLAMLHPLDDISAKLVQLKTGKNYKRSRIAAPQLEAAFQSLSDSSSQFPVNPESDSYSSQPKSEVSADDLNVLLDASSDAPTIRLMNDLVGNAVTLGCSDIHIRPKEHGADVLYRQNGQLAHQQQLNTTQLKSLVSRMKVVSKLDVSDSRLPQDGKFFHVVGGVRTDVRLATMPQIFGEGAVLRILGRQISTDRFQDLGFGDEISERISQLFSLREGLVLVVGPTGSGKSTTLYTALNRLAKSEQNIITIEDPVEIQKPGTNQVQVDEATGLTFPRALRAALRQDPDIILIGEIRDAETAKIAVQAALTGHIVLASLHTSSALAAVPRLIDMGIEPYMVGAVLKGVLAQRLVPKLCPACSSGTENGQTQNGTNSVLGCADCNYTGTRGRQIFGEVALLDEHKIAKLTNIDGGAASQALSKEILGNSSMSNQAKYLNDAGLIGKDKLNWFGANG